MAVAVAIVTFIVGGCTDSGGAPTSGAVPPMVATTTDSVATTTTKDTGSATTVPDTTTSTVPLDQVSIALVEVEVGFDNPVLVAASPDGGADLIVQQSGRIVRADGGSHEVVLDLSADVRFDGEQGLLGFAVHPNFSENGLVYVNYTNTSGATVVEQFAMVDGTVDIGTRREIITIEQPEDTHNGGMIAFGPDGYLWIGMGDGGGAYDPFGHGQNADSLLATMLRISVGNGGEESYVIPDDNPFADGSGGLPEIWAIGLRNPWRFTFDGDTLWIADVGEGSVEEVNVVSVADPALNYGWSVMEGSECFEATSCDSTAFVSPVAEYTHSDGCSITGGVVYSGSDIPSLQRQYFYSDFCSGILRSISEDGVGRDWTDMIGTFGGATGFGIGGDGEMYVVTKQGSLFKLESPGNG